MCARMYAAALRPTRSSAKGSYRAGELTRLLAPESKGSRDTDAVCACSDASPGSDAAARSCSGSDVMRCMLQFAGMLPCGDATRGTSAVPQHNTCQVHTLG